MPQWQDMAQSISRAKRRLKYADAAQVLRAVRGTGNYFWPQLHLFRESRLSVLTIYTQSRNGDDSQGGKPCAAKEIVIIVNYRAKNHGSLHSRHRTNDVSRLYKSRYAGQQPTE
jgi:hypothetical protein